MILSHQDSLLAAALEASLEWLLLDLPSALFLKYYFWMYFEIRAHSLTPDLKARFSYFSFNVFLVQLVFDFLL